jgi:polar amino acid transport system ATP-binding protein
VTTGDAIVEKAVGGRAEAGVPIVRVRGLAKSYGDRVVLRNVDLDVYRGEHVALIGASGSGKTTVLRVLVGLERPDAGTVEIDGASLWHRDRKGKTEPATEKQLRTVRREVGIVFQQFNLFPHMTALANVSLAPRQTLGMDKKAATDLAVGLLEMVGLSDHLSHRPLQMSGGQQQRVAIARALALKPKVMLFDEVTSALDPELVNEVLHVMRKLAVETDMTMIVVTHEMDFAADIAHRVLMFDQGEIIEEGPPSKLFREPQHERTRNFLKVIIDRRGM